MFIQSYFPKYTRERIFKDFQINSEETLLYAIWLDSENCGFVFTEKRFYWNIKTSIFRGNNVTEIKIPSNILRKNSHNLKVKTYTKNVSKAELEKLKKNEQPVFLVMQSPIGNIRFDTGPLTYEEALALRKIFITYIKTGHLPAEYAKGHFAEKLKILSAACKDFISARKKVEKVEEIEGKEEIQVAEQEVAISSPEAEAEEKAEAEPVSQENDEVEQVIEENSWKNIGFHAEQLINKDSSVIDVVVKMTITSQAGNQLDFISFDFDVVDKIEFTDLSCAVSFYQKTYMHVPYLYYLKTDLPFEEYLSGNVALTEGRRVVLKSCNRCGRFLPINIDDEMKTLSFSLHCKKRAPCVHSTFRAYEIQNRDELRPDDLKGLKLEDNKVISYYGHQLECKACKKFFVNAPLNPQRNAQQFKEDGLRRRAIEVLVNKLLERKLLNKDPEVPQDKSLPYKTCEKLLFQ